MMTQQRVWRHAMMTVTSHVIAMTSHDVIQLADIATDPSRTNFVRLGRWFHDCTDVTSGVACWFWRAENSSISQPREISCFVEYHHQGVFTVFFVESSWQYRPGSVWRNRKRFFENSSYYQRKRLKEKVSSKTFLRRKHNFRVFLNSTRCQHQEVHHH